MKSLGKNAIILGVFILFIIIVENVFGYDLNIFVELALLTIYLLVIEFFRRKKA
jgi:hypothetical protein